MTRRTDDVIEITFGQQRIPARLEFRKSDRLSISVNPDRTVTVLAPEGQNLEEVANRVQRRARWIARQRAYFDQFHPLTPPRRYVAGETHLYLGRQYRLKIERDDVESVRLVGRYLTVRLPDRSDVERVRGLVGDWYVAHARPVFDRRLSLCVGSARSLDLPTPQIELRRMAKRWGSCTKSGRIVLNTELVKTPLHCIDYVIVHELCHLKVHDHSPKFYRLLGRCMPDWERRKKRLESFVV